MDNSGGFDCFSVAIFTAAAPPPGSLPDCDTAQSNKCKGYNNLQAYSIAFQSNEYLSEQVVKKLYGMQEMCGSSNSTGKGDKS